MLFVNRTQALLKYIRHHVSPKNVAAVDRWSARKAEMRCNHADNGGVSSARPTRLVVEYARRNVLVG